MPRRQPPSLPAQGANNCLKTPRRGHSPCTEAVQGTDCDALRVRASHGSSRMSLDPCLSEHFRVGSFLSSCPIMDHKGVAVDLPDGSTGHRPRLYIPTGLETNPQLAEVERMRIKHDLQQSWTWTLRA